MESRGPRFSYSYSYSIIRVDCAHEYENDFDCLWLFLGNGDKHRESTPLIRFALDLDPPVVSFDDAFDDGQAEAGADDVARFFVFDAVEAVEDAGLVFGADAVAGVADLEADVVGIVGGGDDDAAFFGGVVDGVGDQVGEHLFHVGAVGQHRRQIGQGGQFQADALGLGLGQVEERLVGQDRRQVEGLLLHVDQTRFHFGKIEQLAGKAHQGLDLLRGALENFALLVGERSGQFVEHDLLLHEHRVERPADLMGDHGHEIGLHLVHLLERGDVVQHGDRAQIAAQAVAERHAAHADDALGTGLPLGLDADLLGDFGELIQGHGQGLIDHGQQGGIAHQFFHRPADGAGPAIVDQVQEGVVGQGHLLLRVGGHHAAGQVVDHGAHPGLLVGDILQGAGVLDGLGHHQAQVLGRKGLGDEVEGAFLHGVHGVIQSSVAGDDDHHGVGMIGPDMAQGFQAGHARHQQVQQDDVVVALGHHAQAHCGIFRLGHVIALVGQHFAAHLTDTIFVVHDQHAGFSEISHLVAVRNALGI